MTRQSKNHSHIWDNVMGGSRFYSSAFCDTTGGSTVSILEYSREETTVATEENRNRNREPKQPRHYPTYPPKVVFVGKSKKNEKVNKDGYGYVTNRERELAEQPTSLPPWKFEPEKKQKYEPHAAAQAFDEYTRRVNARKLKLEKERMRVNGIFEIERLTKKRITDCSKSYQQLNLTNCRNDEIKIDAFVEKVSETSKLDLGKIQKTQKAKPAFYGTIEAEKCAEKAAVHISMAADNLERLQFVAGVVFPEGSEHLKKLQGIENDIKEFNVQLGAHRVKVPKSTAPAQAAHFVITESCFD
ncbi:unnamed protein product [Caenorhabditis sp. 36 PRJEB53466]|nr:unnamed protein product [Caenorhabditis sp. 36 PRJEB53466]